MALHSGSVEILIEKAKFQPGIAVAVAQAIDMATTGASLVTTPALDARVSLIDARFTALRSEIKADMHEIKAELIRWVFLVMLGNVALGAGATAIVNILQHAH